MQLIIVESPTKARTLSRFVSKDFAIEASIGHIRDLPKSELGVDTENNFLPRYVIPTDKKKRVGQLRALAAKASEVILATDPDREGEAIAWHIAAIMEENHRKPKKKQTIIPPFKRIVFHEITKSAILDALKNPRSVDMKLVNAQQARRVLDRLVGYKLSPLLWQKLSKRWLSAGRVQSVAVRLIVEREREIKKFTVEPYFSIESHFTSSQDDDVIIAELVAQNGTSFLTSQTHQLFDGEYTIKKTTIDSETKANELIRDFTAPFTVSAVDTKEIKRTPPPPHTTSTLQQEAGRRLYFSSKKTMQTAQKLYEEGYITYHRTDSVNLSEKFITDSREYIKNTYGPAFVADTPRKFHTKSKVAQEAHEAIRPTNIELQSQALINHGELNRDHIRLYELIWKRAIGSQAKEAMFNSTTIKIMDSKQYQFEAQGSVIVFEGYLVITGRDTEDKIIPKLTVGQSVSLSQSTPVAHTTNPPPRYTEAGLVKTLEEKDIGRPSTYAPIITTIQERQYVTREDKKLIPTDLGDAVTDFLVQYFPDIMSLPFTANLEGKLDNIADGSIDWVPVIREFYGPFIKNIEDTYDIAEKVKVAEEAIDEKCPDCGNGLVIRMGRYGKFVACSTFPKCKYTRQYQEKIDKKCPKCGGDIVVKHTRTKKTFYGCSNYPNCTFAAWKKEDIK